MTTASEPGPARTLVMLATYNEIENLPSLVDEILQQLPDAHVLVIDDNSPDGTGQWCDQRAAGDARLSCLHRPGKLGLGSATVAGLKYAIDHGYDLAVNMDADFSHHPRYLPNLVGGMNRPGQSPVDCMIGSRYCPGGGVEGWPLKRQLMSRGVNLYARALLGLSPKDCSGAFRCYRTELLKRLNFDDVRSRGYSFQEEILWHIKRLGGRFGETPIVFVDRARGASKLDKQEAIASLKQIFRLGVLNWTGR